MTGFAHRSRAEEVIIQPEYNSLESDTQHDVYALHEISPQCNHTEETTQALRVREGGSYLDITLHATKLDIFSGVLDMNKDKFARRHTLKRRVIKSEIFPLRRTSSL